MSPLLNTASLRAQLEQMAEPKYRAFASKLRPGEQTLLGVRLPALRKMAKELAKAGTWRLQTPDDAYMEEIMLRGMAIGYAHNISLPERLAELQAFVPIICNWSVCDSCCATYTFARRDRETMWTWLSPYLHSNDEFSARFGVVMLLTHYKQDAAWAAQTAAALPCVPAQAYYAEMAVAWCACELCLLYPHLEPDLLRQLRPSIQRLTRRKIRESQRS